MKRLVTIVLLLGGLLLTGCSAGADDVSGTQSADSGSSASLEFNATTISGDPFAVGSLDESAAIEEFADAVPASAVAGLAG